VEKALRETAAGKAEGFLSVINWGEVYDTVMREVGLEKAELLAIYPLQITAADQPLTKLAAQFKGRHRIAYAACFAAALAKQEKAVVLTGDPEFWLLEKEIKVSWLR